MRNSYWDNHAELLGIYQSKWYKHLARAGNVTKEQLLEWGVTVVEVEALLEDFSNSLDAFEAWQLRIQSIFMKLNQTERMKIGHNASIFLHTATFSGNCSYNCIMSYHKGLLSHA